MQIKHQQKVGGLQIEETNWHKINPYHCPPMPATISSLQFFIPAWPKPKNNDRMNISWESRSPYAMPILAARHQSLKNCDGAAGKKGCVGHTFVCGFPEILWLMPLPLSWKPQTGPLEEKTSSIPKLQTWWEPQSQTMAWKWSSIEFMRLHWCVPHLPSWRKGMHNAVGQHRGMGLNQGTHMHYFLKERGQWGYREFLQWPWLGNEIKWNVADNSSSANA